MFVGQSNMTVGTVFRLGSSQRYYFKVACQFRSQFLIGKTQYRFGQAARTRHNTGSFNIFLFDQTVQFHFKVLPWKQAKCEWFKHDDGFAKIN